MKSKGLQAKQFEGFHGYSEIHSTFVDYNNNNNNNNWIINKEVAY